MATRQYTVRVREHRLLELPAEAMELGLTPGDELKVFVESNSTNSAYALSDDAEQERFRVLTLQLFAEADATERQPGTYTDPQKAQIAAQIAEQHRQMGMKI